MTNHRRVPHEGNGPHTFYDFSIGIGFLNQAHTSLWPARAWFLEINLVCEVCVCLYVCVCVSILEAIDN